MDKVAQIKQFVEDKKDLIIDTSMKVWEAAELGFQETKSADAIIAALKAEGFEVTTGLGGIPTAFKGVFGSGHPAVGILGEYDALPSLSQKPGCTHHDELVAGGNGHGCGHNALGAGSLGAVIAVKEYMEKNGLKGTIEYYGCPGEETGSGKMFMAREGCFDHLDAAFTWHPGNANSVWGISSLANVCIFFKFKGKTAHAAAAPHLGRSALDACEIMSVGTNYLREHMLPEERVHYAYTDVGGPAPNVVQDHACVFYYMRSPRVSQVLALCERVKDIARGAALITGTELEIQISDGLCDYQPNTALSKALSDAFLATGAPEFDDADRALAAQFRKGYSDDEVEASLKRLSPQYTPEQIDTYRTAPLVEEVAPFVKTDYVQPGSTDVGDVSYACPTAQLNAACYANGTPGHSWQVTAQCGSSIAHKGLLAAAKAMALASVNVMEDPETLQAARAEFNKLAGGKYICPVPDDVVPLL